MGLFDALKDMGNVVSGAVNNAVNDYKEKKAYEEAEDQMLSEIADEQYDFVQNHVDDINEETLQLLMSTAILFYDSFKKDGYADAYDIMEAIITGKDIASWKAEFVNASDIEASIVAFYKTYCEDALETDWYKNSIVSFYEDEACNKLVMMLTQYLALFLPEIAMQFVLEKYGDDTNGLRLFLEEKHYDFYDPHVAWALNSFEDDDISDNFANYERRCLKKYTNIVRNTRLAKCSLKDTVSDVHQIRFNGEKITYNAAIRDNCFCYMQVTFPDVKRLSDLKKYSVLEAVKIPLDEILYWKEYGEQKTELGLKKENAFVNAYAASKGIVLPKQLEERKIDTRYIALVHEKGQLDLDYVCVDSIKALIPQYQFDRVQVKKPETASKDEKKASPSDSNTQGSDIVAAFEQLEKLKSMGLISDEEYNAKRADLMSRI